MATWYVDYEGSAGAANGTSFANRAATIEAIAAPAAGDTIRIKATAAATALGSSTWTNNSSTVTVPAGLTANISLCQAAWTASANVTTTTSATRKEGTLSTSAAFAAGFTTGLASYEAMSSTDFSGFQQISFWIRTSVVIAANSLQLKLCSDNAGVTAVNTINIPAINPINTWHAITVDTGGALGAAIQSVALYAAVDPGIPTVLIDNILACKSAASVNCLTLNSIISKNTTGEGWFAPQSINGTTFTLDYGANTAQGTSPVYLGTTETVATSVRACFNKTVTAAATGCLVPPVTGTAVGGLITYSGGWNRTDMSTQTDYTFFMGANGLGSCFSFPSAKNFLKYEYVGSVRHNNGVLISANNAMEYADNIYVSNSTNASIGSSGCYTFVLSNFWITAALNFGVNMVLGRNSTYTNGYVQSCFATAKAAMYLDDVGGVYTNIAIKHTGYAIQSFFGSDHKFISCSTSSSGTSTFDFPQWNGNVQCFNCSWGEATRVSSQVAFSNIVVFSEKEGGTLGNNVNYSDGLTTGYDYGNAWWYISPTSTNRSSSYPGLINIGQVGCQANSLVTVSVVVNRTNTGITTELVCPGGQIAGVASDVVATAAASANQDETLTITFTPTQNGVVNLLVRAYGGTTNTAKIKGFANLYQA